jgi:hypothetical protein
MRHLLSALSMAAFAARLFCQAPTAELAGTVHDTTGGVISGAHVTIVNEETGTKRSTLTSALGQYVVPLLPPGRYRATVQHAGFRTLERKGLVLHVDEPATVDFQLDVGSVTETVTVQGEASALDLAQASQGTVIDNTKIVDLPLNGRDPYALVALAPGVTPLGGFSTPRVFQEQAYQSDFTVNGGVPMTNDILLDGTSNTATGHGQAAMTPSVDAIEEFKVQTSSFSAEYGRSGGGIVNIVTKSGGNTPHGTAYEFFRNDVLDGNNFFNNRVGIANPPFRFNDFGATLGGPVIFPKLYNGRNRTFFFASYEGDRARRGQFFTGTVPTAAMRLGDFSQLKNAQGQLIVIYDPNSTRAQGSGSVRDPLAGNIIPAAQQDKAAVNVSKYYPLPNQNTALVSNNFITNAAEADNLDTWQWRIDHNINENNRLFVRTSHDRLLVVAPNFYGNGSGPPSIYSGSHQPDWQGAVGDTQNFGAHTLFDIRAGYARNGFVRVPTSLGFDPTRLGLPAALTQQAQVLQFPNFNPTGYSGVGAEPNDMFFLGADTYSLVPQLTHIHGRHTLKIGGDYRVYRHNTWNPSNPTGGFNFSAAFTQGPNPLVSTLNGGDAYASMLMGAMASASAAVRAYQSFQTIYTAEYLQDDFKVSSRLTLNLGLRYDYETPRTERFNRQSNFNYDIPNPVGPQVGLPDLRGGLVFDGVNGTPRGWNQPDRNNFAPRFGFAYHLTTDTAVRGGYGITYLPGGTTFNGYGAGQEGFSVTTSVATSINNGLTRFTSLSDAFSSGLLQPAGTSQGLQTELGLSVRGDPRWIRTAYLQVWNLNIQRQLPGHLLVEAGYAGSRGVKIPMTFQMDQLPDEHLSLGTALNKQVANPFVGLVSSGTLSLPTVSAGQLLRPYPQFNAVSFSANDAGSSTYHSFQLRVEKRLSHGFTFLAAYTVSKNITDVDTIDSWIAGQFSAPVQDSNNRRLDRSVATIDVPQRLVLNYVYELPIGQGKRLLGGAHGITNTILGGWRVTGISTFQSGRPLALTTASNNTDSYGGGSRPNNNGESAKLSDPTIARWLNTAVFSQPAPFTFGTTGRLLPDAREPGIANFDFTGQKNFSLTERFRLQLRAEFFNIMNTPQFGRPGQVFGTPQFGVISTQANSPRQIQFGLKLLW